MAIVYKNFCQNNFTIPSTECVKLNSGIKINLPENLTCVLAPILPDINLPDKEPNHYQKIVEEENLILNSLNTNLRN